jgi:tryptophan 2,3-dioxygenase
VAVRAVRRWVVATGEAFPYDETLSAYFAVGKHFVPEELTAALSAARRHVGGMAGDRLARFLDVALDKADGRYDYTSYLALDLLPLPNHTSAARPRDRLTALLLADAMRFELDVLDGRTTVLPRMRPPLPLVRKRCRLAVRTLRPVLARLGVTRPAPTAEPLTAARAVVATVWQQSARDEQQQLRLSMLPVWVAHDEYLFVRVLQSFETTFAFMVTQIEDSISAMRRVEPEAAARPLLRAARALAESAPMFSTLATMQQEAFRTFRAYTEGASAIQSLSYKRLESLCRRPDDERLDSAAYRWVPQVRSAVRAGQPTLEDAYLAAERDGLLTSAGAGTLREAADALAATHQRWRHTHYRLAERMLGDGQPGTGYTEGIPYLRKVADVPVFRQLGRQEQASLAPGDGSLDGAEGEE